MNGSELMALVWMLFLKSYGLPEQIIKDEYDRLQNIDTEEREFLNEFENAI